MAFGFDENGKIINIFGVKNGKDAPLFTYKGNVSTTDDLPDSAEIGDVYFVESNMHKYAWNDTEWNDLGLGTIGGINSQIIEIEISGESGSFTTEQLTRILNDKLNVVLILDGERYFYADDKNDYRSYININTPLNTQVTYKTIYINTYQGAVDYGSWSLEETIPVESISIDGEIDTTENHVQTIKNDLGDLGDQVVGIEQKIPDTATSLNKLATESYVDSILPSLPSEDGTYVLKYVLDGGLGSLQWILEE